MEAIILAAGYGTRLGELTQNKAKPLLRVGPMPIIDHIMKKLEAIEGLGTIHVVSNHRFYDDFVVWAQQRPEHDRIRVYNDGTFENADRRGAIGDAEWVIQNAPIAEETDIVLIAGDNLFDFDMGELKGFFDRHGTSCVTYHFPDPSLIPAYSTVEVDGNRLVTSFIEKPDDPQTDLIGICCYMISGPDKHRVSEYLQAGNNKDAPGYFMTWLHKQVPVHAFEFDGLWYDIGDLKSLTDADQELSKLYGLPVPERYEP